MLILAVVHSKTSEHLIKRKHNFFDVLPPSHHVFTTGLQITKLRLLNHKHW